VNEQILSRISYVEAQAALAQQEVAALHAKINLCSQTTQNEANIGRVSALRQHSPTAAHPYLLASPTNCVIGLLLDWVWCTAWLLLCATAVAQCTWHTWAHHATPRLSNMKLCRSQLQTCCRSCCLLTPSGAKTCRYTLTRQDHWTRQLHCQPSMSTRYKRSMRPSVNCWRNGEKQVCTNANVRVR
jgi:hypothetical protein